MQASPWMGRRESQIEEQGVEGGRGGWIDGGRQGRGRSTGMQLTGFAMVADSWWRSRLDGEEQKRPARCRRTEKAGARVAGKGEEAAR